MNKWEIYGDDGLLTEIWLNNGIRIGAIFAIEDDAVKVVDKVGSNLICLNLNTHSRYKLVRVK